MSLVSEQKFNELVGSTTHYLEDLISRVKTLEKRVDELSLKKKPKSKECSE